MKPFAESCADNQQVIYEQLEKVFADRSNVIEIGSGTGQHAVYFAERMPHLKWQPSDLKENIPGMQLWFDEAELSNIKQPAVLDVSVKSWPFNEKFDAAFTANTMHIMAAEFVEKMFAGLGEVMEGGAIFCSYGPYNYNGQFTSESNARFDQWLKSRNPVSGIRDIDELQQYAGKAEIKLVDDLEMPVNNRLLVWRKD